MIPEGFNQFAESCLNGNGGITATAYSNYIEGERWIFLTIKDPATTLYNVGPIPLRAITTLNHVIQDIIFINKLHV